MAAAPASLPPDAELARHILSDRRYQATLTDAPRVWQLPLGSIHLPFLSVELPSWVLLLVLSLAIAVVAIRWGWSYRGARPATDAPAELGTQAARTEVSLQRARRLAESGAHVEAVHVLLLVALDQWTGTSGAAFGPDQTSREVLRALPASVSPARRDALDRLIRAVEWSWFGGRPLGSAEYEEALECCRVIVGSEA